MNLATIQMTFDSSRNGITDRKVDIYSFDETYLVGYCHLRRQRRTFRLNKVITVVDIDTGEVITDLFDFLLVKLRNYECRDPEETLYKLLMTEHDFMLCLVWFGRLNGILFRRKKKVVAKACRELTGDKNFSLEQLDFLSSGFHYIIGTSHEDFLNSVRNLAKSDTRKKNIILGAVREIATIPKTKNGQDVKALQFIEDQFFLN